MSLPSEEKLAEYYAFAKTVCDYKGSFETFKRQFMEHYAIAITQK